MDNNETPNVPDDDLDVNEMRVWIEFSAWCALVMTPIIWWLQGPSVSTDQFVVRTSLVVISLVVAVGMRIWAIVHPISVIEGSAKGHETSLGSPMPRSENPSP